MVVLPRYNERSTNCPSIIYVYAQSSHGLISVNSKIKEYERFLVSRFRYFLKSGLRQHWTKYTAEFVRKTHEVETSFCYGVPGYTLLGSKNDK